MSTKNNNPVLDKIGFHDFKPIPLLAHALSQTVIAYYRPPYSENLKSHIHYISLPDNDVVALVENTPDNWQPNDRIVVMVHGLAGSYLSNYNIRLCQAFLKQGYKVFRLNLRGCGPGLGLARLPHHAGNSDDTQFILHWVAKQYPLAPLTQIGFSLGGNITLKMLGEADINRLPVQLDSAIAISPPIDILNSSLLLNEQRNRMFDQFFVKHLLEHVRICHEKFPDLPEVALPRNLTVYDLNDLYIAPRAGFNNALDYYNRCSAGPLLNKISIPTLVLHADDDPFVSVKQYLPCNENPNIDFILTKAGGHLGWMGIREVNGKRSTHQWMDEAVVCWLNWFENKDNAILKKAY